MTLRVPSLFCLAKASHCAELMKPSPGLLAFSPHLFDCFRLEKRIPKKPNPTSLAGHFYPFGLLGTAHPQKREKTKGLVLVLLAPIPPPPARARCPRGRMPRPSAARPRRAVTAQGTSPGSATRVAFHLRLWLEPGNLLRKYRKESQSKCTAVYKFMRGSPSPIKLLPSLSRRCPCLHQSLFLTLQRPSVPSAFCQQ